MPNGRDFAGTPQVDKIPVNVTIYVYYLCGLYLNIRQLRTIEVFAKQLHRDCHSIRNAFVGA